MTEEIRDLTITASVGRLMELMEGILGQHGLIREAKGRLGGIDALVSEIDPENTEAVKVTFAAIKVFTSRPLDKPVTFRDEEATDEAQ